jgi:hypothetical protein
MSGTRIFRTRGQRILPHSVRDMHFLRKKPNGFVILKDNGSGRKRYDDPNGLICSQKNQGCQSSRHGYGGCSSPYSSICAESCGEHPRGMRNAYSDGIKDWIRNDRPVAPGSLLWKSTPGIPKPAAGEELFLPALLHRHGLSTGRAFGPAHHKSMNRLR